MNNFKNERLGSSESLRVELIDGDTDAAISLAGATTLSAKATHVDSGSEVNFTSTIVDDAANGIIKMFRSINTFAEAGVYDVLITYTDSVGEVRKYPKDESGLKIRFS